MLSFLKRRAVVVGLGLALLALFIWYAGPLFTFAAIVPLASPISRLVAIALVVALWGVWAWLKRRQAARASDQLAAAVVKQAEKEDRPSADVVQLRERFEEAVKTLKDKRKGGHSLYELPWYVIVGAPGAGKTTALVNSGLHFPLEQRAGKGALRGVGGTRNCDWWFTDEAVFLDTAGRFTTQDSDASADSAGWAEFLALLKKYRKRRPVNGVILAASAHDLMVQGQAGRDAHVAAARRRLTELNKELRIQLPVYVLVTKCDLVSGFTEYFDDVAQEGRTQVWGVTFPFDATQKGQAAGLFPAEFDALMSRLNERVFARLEDDRDVRRRAKVFAFPQQMAALRETLTGLVSELFASTRFDDQIQLRGVYFTSGTQEGTPIDRLLGAIGRRFAVAPEAVAPGGRGKAYFIERLLKDVLLSESGLAGVNRRVEIQKAAAQLGAYVAMAAVAVLGVIAFAVSYNRNGAYIDQVATDVAGLKAVPAPATVTSLGMLLPRLDAVRAVVDSADRHRDGVPISMRWGLYQGTSLGNGARDAYARELTGALLPQLAERIKQRLTEYAANPEYLYLYLKAYLMLGLPEHFDRAHFGYLADLEWKAAYANDPEAGAKLAGHFARLLEYKERLPAVPLDQPLVDQARRTIPPEVIPRLIYSLIKLNYSGDSPDNVRLDSLGAGQAFRRRSGASLTQPISSLYTSKVFAEVTSQGTEALERQFAEDRWVWGESRPTPMDSAKLRLTVTDLYEKDYIATWEGVLSDLGLASSGGLDETKRALRVLAAPTSPLRKILETVDTNTFLVKSMDTTKPAGTIGSTLQILDKLKKQGQQAIGVPTTTPGAQVTAHFAQLHQLMAGEPGKAPIDAILAQIQQINEKLQPVGQIGGPDQVSTLAQVGQMGERLKQDAADLPKSVGQIVTEVGNLAQAASRSGLGGDLSGRYQQEVVQPCRAAIDGRYPFGGGGGASVPDVLMADFGRVFGSGGVFEKFYTAHLEPIVDTSAAAWRWRTDASGATVGLSPGVLARFQQARQIRDAFFPPGAQMPRVEFHVTYTSAGLDATFLNSQLEIDGTVVRYGHGPEKPSLVVWPGEKATGAAFILVPRQGAVTPIAEKGPWAFFRLIEGRLKDGPTGSYELEFLHGGRITKILLTPSGIQNSFATRNRMVLPQFRCQ